MLFDLDTWRMYTGDNMPKPKKKKPGALGPLKCRECGRSGVTLRKCSDGQYICEDCMKKGEIR